MLTPRLTVNVLARNAQARLPRLLAELPAYADEILVGVDASSDDRTLEIASDYADVVYRFHLPRPGQLSPARALPFDYATGDWILSIDDDESMEPTFDALVGSLMAAPNVTHYYFPRKWIVADDPYAYVDAPPWFPNWAPRLFRNDRSLVFKPAGAHTMYHLLGPGFYEERTAIHHFEPLWCTPKQRAAKVAAYRNAGATEASETYYEIPHDAPRRPVTPREPALPVVRRAGVVHDAIREAAAPEHPPWAASFERVEMPATMRPGEVALVRVTVRNTGVLTWAPTYAQWPANQWPMLRLTYHLYAGDGGEIDYEGNHRTLLPRVVVPGEAVTFVDTFVAPTTAGDYVVAWDMLSEGHLWFSQIGSAVHAHPLTVRDR